MVKRNPTDKAIAFRDLVRSIAADAVRSINPPSRVGLVQSIDRENNLCWVTFPGDEVGIKVNMTPGAQPRYAADDLPSGDSFADTVRVGGRPGAYYLEAVISSSSVNREVENDLTDLRESVYSDDLAPIASPRPSCYSFTGNVVVDWEVLSKGPRTESSNPDAVTYEVHAATSDAAAPSAATLVTADGLPPLFVAFMPGGVVPLSYDADTYFAIVARDEDGAASPSEWVAARPRRAGNDDLEVDENFLIARNILAEAMKLVNLAVTGDFTANLMTGNGTASFRALVELAQGSSLRMRGSTTAPVVPPALDQYVPSVTTVSPTDYINGHGDVSGGLWTQIEGTDERSPAIVSYDLSTGQRTVRVPAVTLPPQTPAGIFATALVNIGSNWYLWYNKNTGSGPGTIVTTWAYQVYDSNFNLTSSVEGIPYNPGMNVNYLIFGKHENGRLLVAGHQVANSYAFIHEVNPATGAIAATARMANNNTWPDITNYGQASILGGTFDFDDTIQRYIWSTKNQMRVYNSSLSRLTVDEWPLVTQYLTGFYSSHLCWGNVGHPDGRSRFVHMVRTSLSGTQNNRALYKYTTGRWNSSTNPQRSTIWVGSTWYNDVSTPQETLMGAIFKFTPRQRWGFKLTYGDFPNTVNKVRVYIVGSTNQPADTSNFWIRYGESGSRFVFIEPDSEITGVAGIAPPGQNPPNATVNPRPFVGGSSAGIYDAETGYWLASGEYKFDLNKDKSRISARWEKRTNAQPVTQTTETPINNSGLLIQRNEPNGLYTTRDIGGVNCPTFNISVPGEYEVYYKITWAINGTGRRLLIARLFPAGGGTAINIDKEDTVPTGHQTTQRLTVVRNFVAGDQISPIVWHNATATTLDLTIPSATEENFIVGRIRRIA